MPSVNFIEEKKRQKRLIIILIVIVVVTIVILKRGYFSKEKGKRFFSQGSVSVVNYPEVKIDFSVFDSELLKNLSPFERVSSFQEKKGRKNPFLPY